MIQTKWKAGSLRARVAVAMALAVLPLAVSAGLGFVILNNGVIAAYKDVAGRQREQIDPTQRLQIALLQADERVEDYLIAHDQAFSRAYRTERERIEANFAKLHGILQGDPEAQILVARSREDWTAADRLSNEILTTTLTTDDPHLIQTTEQFEGLTRSAVDKLVAVHDDLDADLDKDYFAAHMAYERAEWIAGIAAAASLALVAMGVMMFGRLIRGSVDRLVEGAERFAAGDRTHRIEVQVPPELHKVANEFNRMIERIHESEAALVDRALRDGLTGLLNRRAFDEAMVDAFARMERFDERIALLMIDLDHFKHVNDTYGHAAGDEVIRAIVEHMRSGLRKIDRAFRIGGEEFVAMLPGADGMAAEAVAERLRQAIQSHPVSFEGHKIPITASCGVAAASSAKPGRPNELIERADAALYRAKSAGRNRVVRALDDEFDAVRDELTQKQAG